MMEPMLLHPAGKDYLWGGNRLEAEYNKKLGISPLAETWECSTQPDGLCTVVSGAHSGKALAQVLQEHPEYLGEKANSEEGLPILVKLIDANQDLSFRLIPFLDH